MLGFSQVLLLFTSSFALAAPVHAEAEVKCGNADAGFLLDMSGTINNRTYHREIKLIQGLVRAFDVRLGGSRAGLVTFNDNAETNIDFDMHPTVHEFNRAVRKLTKYGGRTRIDRGIDESTLILYNQRYNLKLGNQKYLFVISDGKQTWDYVNRRRTNLKERTWLLRHQGVKIIAIAMGDHPDLWYLNQLVQFPELEVIIVSSQANIKAKVKQIHRIACSQQPAVSIACKRLADIGFLLDQSSSIGGPLNFRFETRFVKDVVDKFSAGQNNQIRAGVIKYGETSELIIKLDEFTDLNNFKDALDHRVKFIGSRSTRIDRALGMANKQLFTEANGDRPGVPNYLILVTDGKQNSGNLQIDNNLVPWFAKPLWDRNITIAAVGVAQARLLQLKQIAGPHGTAIYTKRLQDLDKAVDEIVPTQCRGCHEKVNLGFLVDASGTTKIHYYKMKRLVYYIAEAFKPQRTKLLASVIRFSTKAKIDIRFRQFDELSSFQAEIDTRMPFMGGYTFIDKGLRAAEQEFDGNTNNNLPKVLVVLTDGRQTGGNLTLPLVRNAANDLRRKGVRIVVVSVGPRCRQFSCQGPLTAMTGGTNYIVRWQFRDDIMATSEMVARIACPPRAKV